MLDQSNIAIQEISNSNYRIEKYNQKYSILDDDEFILNSHHHTSAIMHQEQAAKVTVDSRLPIRIFSPKNCVGFTRVNCRNVKDDMTNSQDEAKGSDSSKVKESVN